MATNKAAKPEPAKQNLPRVDFYVSKDSGSNSDSEFTLLTTCRIAEKALTAGHRIHIRMRNPEECEKLDALLWTFRDHSFIPHELSNDPIDRCPVTISPEINENHADMLLNVSDEIAENIKQFQRIAEIIDNQPESINAGRERYRFYRENGLDPQHHEVS